MAMPRRLIIGRLQSAIKADLIFRRVYKRDYDLSLLYRSKVNSAVHK